MTSQMSRGLLTEPSTLGLITTPPVLNITNRTADDAVPRIPTIPTDFLIGYCVIAGGGVMLNIVHILVMRTLPHASRANSQNFRFTLQLLAAIDLTMAVARLLLSNGAAQRLLRDQHAICVASSMLMQTCGLTEGLLLLLVSVDRLCVLRGNLSYQQSLFVRLYRKLTAVGGALALLLLIVIAILYEDGFQVKGIGVCQIGDSRHPHLSAVMSLLYSSLFGIIVCLYAWTLFRLKHFLRTASIGARDRQIIKQVALTVGLLVAAKLLLWSPFIVLFVMRTHHRDCYACVVVGLLTLGLNPIVNPMLYGSSDVSYRRYVYKRLTACCCSPRTRQRATESTDTSGIPKCYVNSIELSGETLSRM